MADTAETETPPEDMVALPEPTSDTVDGFFNSVELTAVRVQSIQEIQNVQTILLIGVLFGEGLLCVLLAALGMVLR